jgi:hypothetical protein
MSDLLPHLNNNRHANPRILLTDTTRWPLIARLSLAFSRLGCEVGVICPMPGHPVVKVGAARENFRYNGFAPITSLRSAIEAFRPDVIVPGCDRGVLHLHALYANCCREGDKGKAVAALIDRSFGSGDALRVITSRSNLLELARAEGILVPPSTSIRECSDFVQSGNLPPLPWVIKSDGTWGGRGVRMADTPEQAQSCYRELTRHAGLPSLLKRAILNRDRDWIWSDWNRPSPAIVLQSSIDGRPANCAVCCHDGEVTAAIAVEVIRARGATGPASVVQVVEGPEMIQAAKKIARRLRLSGFFGLDFVIDNQSGAAWMIEMNPRCTPPCGLALGSGRDLPAAMWAWLTKNAIPETRPITTQARIAYFPQFVAQGDNEQLGSMYHDIPSNEPKLADALLHPWQERSMAGQLLDSARHRVRATKEETCIFEGALQTPAAFIADITPLEVTPMTCEKM